MRLSEVRLISLPLSEAFFLPASEKGGVREPSELNIRISAAIIAWSLFFSDKKKPNSQSNVIVLELALHCYLCLKMEPV